MKGNKRLKYICSGIAVLACLSSVPAESIYAEWKDDNKGLTYSENGHNVTGWKHLDYVSQGYRSNSSGEDDTTNYKCWYYFGHDGYMKTGWIKDNDKWYYLKEDGSMARNCSKDGYALGNDGAWIEDGGWKKDSTGWWYSYGGTKGYAIGWKAFEDIDSVKHNQDNEYLNPGDIWYYFDQSGYMKTGWLKYDGKWYYLNKDGSMARNSTVDGYVIDDNGAWVEKIGRITYTQDLVTKPEKSSYPLGTTSIKYYLINNTGKKFQTFIGNDRVEKYEDGEWKLLKDKFEEEINKERENGYGPIDIMEEIYKVYEGYVELTNFEGFDSSKPGKYRVIFNGYNGKNGPTVFCEEFELK